MHSIDGIRACRAWFDFVCLIEASKSPGVELLPGLAAAARALSEHLCRESMEAGGIKRQNTFDAFPNVSLA